MPPLPEVRRGERLSASGWNDLVGMAARHETLRGRGVAIYRGPTSATVLADRGAGREYVWPGVITRVIAPGGEDAKDNPENISYEAIGLGRGKQSTFEPTVARVIGRPHYGRIRRSLQERTPIWPAKVGDPCIIWRVPQVDANGLGTGRYENWLEVLTEELAIGGPCEGGESAGSGESPTGPDCGCAGGGLPEPRPLPAGGGDSLPLVSQPLSPTMPRFTQQAAMLDMRKYGQRFVFDVRGMQTGSLSVKWEMGEIWDGNSAGVDDATITLYKSNDGVTAGDTIATLAYNARFTGELDLDGFNFIIGEMASGQSGEMYLTVTFNGKNPFAAADTARVYEQQQPGIARSGEFTQFTGGGSSPSTS